MTFNLDSIPNKRGCIALVTGANSGIGYEVALAMAKKQITVILACRNSEKANLAKQAILKTVPDAQLDTLQIDLSKLSSVHEAASLFRNKYSTLNILINNAGIMFPPYRKTEDGFESQIATNSLSHFLLTALLIDQMPNSPDSRITWLGSSAHKAGRINFSDINFEAGYSKMAAYGQSKLACLMYAFELDRRLKLASKTITSNCAHPGGANTDLSRHMPRWLLTLMKYTLLPFITQPAKQGAMPVLEAALSQASEGGQYYGPQGFLEMTGPSGIATASKQAQDIEKSKQLWLLSEQLTGIRYDLS